MRLALLLAAVCLGLAGCAKIKSVFEPPVPWPSGTKKPEATRTHRPPRATPRVKSPRAKSPRLASPSPTAPAPTPDALPPVLSPALSADDEQQLLAKTQRRIDGAEQRLRQIDPAKLAAGQRDSLQTVRSFLDKAREAVLAQDIQRAYTLANKAFLLADELSRRPR